MLLAHLATVLAKSGQPTLDLNFLKGSLDPRITFTRPSGATYYDATGTLVTAASNVPRIDYGPGAVTNFVQNSTANVPQANTGRFTLTTSAEVPAAFPGSAVFKTVSNASTGDNNCGYPVIASASSIVYVGRTVSAYVWVWIPSSYTGSALHISSDGGGTELARVDADLSKRDQWQRISLAFVVTVAGQIGIIRPGTINTGDVFYQTAWQLEVDTPTPHAYVPTFGNPVTAYLNGVTNWLKQSGDLSQLPWTGGNARTANAALAPDGTNSAVRYVEGVGNGSSTQQAGFPWLAATTYTQSIYAKPSDQGTKQYLTVVFWSAAFGVYKGAVFDVALGTVTNTNAGVTASIVPVGNGWYRCIATATTTTGGTTNVEWRIGSSSTDIFQNQPGDGVSGLFLWGAQLEISSTANSYAPTTTAPANVGAVPLGLLVEEQRTNFIRNNTMVGAVVGTPGTLPTGWALSGPNQIVAVGTENGIPFIDVNYNGAAASGAVVLQFDLNQALAVTPGTSVVTGSVYSRLIAGSLSGVTIWFPNRFYQSDGSTFVSQNLVPVTPTSSPLATQRFSITETAPALSGFVCNSLRFSTTGAYNFTLRIGLPQLELGAFATSPILTSGSTATRAADIGNMHVGSWFNPQAGTLFSKVILEGRNGTFAAFTALVGANANTDFIDNVELTSAAPALPQVGSNGTVAAGGTTIAYVASINPTVPYNTLMKFASAWALGAKINGAFNIGSGAVPSTSVATVTTLPVITNLQLFGTMHFQNASSGWLQQVTYHARQRTLAEITQAVT